MRQLTRPNTAEAVGPAEPKEMTVFITTTFEALVTIIFITITRELLSITLAE